MPNSECNELYVLKNKAQRRELYADQRRAAQIYKDMTPEGERRAGRGVTLCGWTQVAQRETRIMREGDRAYFEGLCVCSLRWVCPVCTKHKSEEGRQQLNAALAEGRRRGLHPVMMTLTARHDRSMTLRGFWDQLSSAEKRLKTSRAWKALNAGWLAGGFAKATEATHSDRNGWHPHLHLILMVEAESQALALAEVEKLRAEWLHQLNAVGLDGTSRAAQRISFDVRGASEAGAYVAKWGAGEELALSHRKLSKAEAGRTPWQLLRDARKAETDRERKRSAALWWEFVQCFKGVHQLRQSPKFRALVEEYEPEETGDEPEAEAEEVYNFGAPAQLGDDPNLWYLGRWKRLRMLEAVESQAAGHVEDAARAVEDVIFSPPEDDDAALLRGDVQDVDEWSPVDSDDLRPPKPAPQAMPGRDVIELPADERYLAVFESEYVERQTPWYWKNDGRRSVFAPPDEAF